MTGLKQHPEYKASGVDWLGDIPAHWEMVKLKNGFDLQKRPAIKSAGIVTAFRDGQVTLRSNRRIDGYTEGDKQIGYQTIHPGDLVIHAMDAFAGAIGVSDSLGQSTPVYSACTPKPEFNSHFYARALRHIALTGYISSLAKGVRERSTDFRWADAKELPVPRPPIEEQNNIVSFLDRETAQIDDLIGKQERLIDLLGEKRQATITHAVTKGLDPTAPTKPSGIPWLGDIPAHWKVSKVKHVKSLARNAFVDGPFGSNLKSEHFVLNGDVFVIESNFATTGKLREVELKTISEEHFNTISRSEVRAGDIVIAKIGARFGKSAILPRISKKAVVSGNSMKLTVDTKVSSADWIALQLSVQKTVGDLDLYASVTAQPALSLGGVNELTVLIPPMHEQTRILNEIRKSSERLGRIEEAAKRMVKLLYERRSALISAAVTGKIHVRAEGPAN